MPKITIMPSGRVVDCASGESLLDALLENGITVDNPCNGKGTCGKCRVRLLSDAGLPVCDTEKRKLSQTDLDEGVRLACCIDPIEDLTVELVQTERKHEVLATGLMPDFEFAPETSKRIVSVRRPTLDDQTPFEDQICDQLGIDAVDAEVLAQAGLVPGEWTAVLHADRVLCLEAGDTTGSLYGVAIDIGTTTVVCALVDMATGRVLANSAQVNAQKKYGLDVLTRITYEMEHPDDGVRKLQKAMVASINGMISDACARAGVAPSSVYEITVGANCTMMHMLLGIDARCIGKAPFAPAFARAKELPAASIGIQVAPGARMYCLPHVSAYIGADIVAGAYVCELRKEPGNVLFIDIGTNGEIVLANQGKLLSCSCAAGPALEGMNISAGMRAEEGAIEEVEIAEGGNMLTVIGDAEPVGLCGSGILAVMRELLRCGFVRKNGAFAKPGTFAEDDYRRSMIVEGDDGKRSFVLTEEPERLLVTQGDVRQVQLAKGAILSGFVALLNKAGIAMDDLEKVVIAGQFGAHLAASSITGTGILPFEVEDRIVYAGNTSMTGAYMALMSGHAKRGMERLADDMEYMELGASDNYERLFSECLIFPEFKRG